MRFILIILSSIAIVAGIDTKVDFLPTPKDPKNAQAFHVGQKAFHQRSITTLENGIRQMSVDAVKTHPWMKKKSAWLNRMIKEDREKVAEHQQHLDFHDKQLEDAKKRVPPDPAIVSSDMYPGYKPPPSLT